MGLTTGDMVMLWMNDSSLNKRRVGDVVLVVQLVLVGDVELENIRHGGGALVVVIMWCCW